MCLFFLTLSFVLICRQKKLSVLSGEERAIGEGLFCAKTNSLFIFSTECSVLFCTVIQSFAEVIHYREIHLQSCLQSSVVPARQSDFDLLLSLPSQHYFKDFQAEQLSLFSVENLQPALKGRSL